MNYHRSSVDGIRRVRLQFIRKGRPIKMAKGLFVTGYRCVFYGVRDEKADPPIIHTNDESAKDGRWEDLDRKSPAHVEDMLKAFVALGVIEQSDMDEQMDICTHRSFRREARCKRSTITRELVELGIEIPKSLDNKLKKLGSE